MYIQEITAKHIRYFCPPELSPILILLQMINNDQKFDEENFVIEPIYNENRQKIIQIIRMVNIALNNSSQTFFM